MRNLPTDTNKLLTCLGLSRNSLPFNALWSPPHSLTPPTRPHPHPSPRESNRQHHPPKAGEPKQRGTSIWFLQPTPHKWSQNLPTTPPRPPPPRTPTHPPTNHSTTPPKTKDQTTPLHSGAFFQPLGFKVAKAQALIPSSCAPNFSKSSWTLRPKAAASSGKSTPSAVQTPRQAGGPRP